MAVRYVSIPKIADITRRLNQAADAVGDPAFFARTGEYVRATTKVRTLKGLDADGKPFKPYSARYALLRMMYGRQVGYVDLMWSGQMLGAMTSDVAPNQVRVFFLPTAAFDPINGGIADATQAEKAAYLYKKRKFFALSAEQILHITGDFQATVGTALGGKRGG